MREGDVRGEESVGREEAGVRKEGALKSGVRKERGGGFRKEEALRGRLQ